MENKVLVTLLMVLSWGMCSINVNAQAKRQSATKRTTPIRSANAQQGGQIMKFKQVGEDGYVWYKLKRGNLCGARDAEGNNIIPIKYDDITYVCTIEKYAYNYKGKDGKHYFEVSMGRTKGAYTREGRLVISTDKNYTSIEMNLEGIKPCWLVATQGSESMNGLLDMKGNTVIEPGKYRVVYPSGVAITIGGYNGKKGVCDWNGRVIVPCQYYNCWINALGELKYCESKDESLKEKKIDFDSGTIYDYQSYDNLIYNYEDSSINSSSSSSSQSSSKSSSSTSTKNQGNSGNSTQTVVVEHHRDPVPVQEWQQCPGCYGSGQCPMVQCGGSGWYYVGDRVTTCSRCRGSGKCTTCAGKGGHYITVYR